jgi:hypothetical protein
LPGIVIALPGGMLGQRFGAKRVVLAGLALMAIGGAVMGCERRHSRLRGRPVISGTGACCCSPCWSPRWSPTGFAGREIVDRDGDRRLQAGRSGWRRSRAVRPLAAACGWSAIMHLGALSACAPSCWSRWSTAIRPARRCPLARLR